jgi:hypothetical protein
MNDEKLLNSKSISKYYKSIVLYLSMNDNLKLMNKNEMEKIKSIRANIDLLFWKGIAINCGTYILFFKYFLNNKTFLNKNKILRYIIDLSFILSSTYAYSKLSDYTLISQYKAKIEDIKKDNKYILKNKILMNEHPYVKELNFRSYDSFMRFMQQFNERNLYFILIIILRVLI